MDWRMAWRKERKLKEERGRRGILLGSLITEEDCFLPRSRLKKSLDVIAKEHIYLESVFC